MKALKSDCLFVVQVCQLLEAPTENETDTDQTEPDKIELDTTEPDKFASRPQNIWHPPCVHALLLVTSSTAKIGSISQVAGRLVLQGFEMRYLNKSKCSLAA